MRRQQSPERRTKNFTRTQKSRAVAGANKQINETTLYFDPNVASNAPAAASGGDNSWMQWAVI